MTIGFNHCVLLGEVCRGPWKITPTDATPHVSFYLEVAEPSTRTGDIYKLFVPVICFGKMQPIAAALTVGDPLIVMGRLTWHRSEKAPRGSLSVTAWKLTPMMPDAPPPTPPPPDEWF